MVGNRAEELTKTAGGRAEGSREIAGSRAVRIRIRTVTRTNGTKKSMILIIHGKNENMACEDSIDHEIKSGQLNVDSSFN